MLPKEVSDTVMELHCNDPERLEFLLEFIDTHDCGKDAIVKLATNNDLKRNLVPTGIYPVADKYDRNTQRYKDTPLKFNAYPSQMLCRRS